MSLHVYAHNDDDDDDDDDDHDHDDDDRDDAIPHYRNTSLTNKNIIQGNPLP